MAMPVFNPNLGIEAATLTVRFEVPIKMRPSPKSIINKEPR
jgi:hypothetical protein